jgi:hypothetical protein
MRVFQSTPYVRIVFYQMECRAILIDRLLKNSDCRLLKTISEGRRAENRRAEAY